MPFPKPPAPPPRPAISTFLTRWTFVLPLAAAVAALAIGGKPLAAQDGVFLAKPYRRRTISDRHRLRWSGAGRCDLTRRSSRGVSVRPRRTDGRLGYPGRFGRVPQPDPRKCSGTRQSIDPNPGVLARWLSRHLLGSQAKRPERRRHWHLGGADPGRRAQAIP